MWKEASAKYLLIPLIFSNNTGWSSLNFMSSRLGPTAWNSAAKSCANAGWSLAVALELRKRGIGSKKPQRKRALQTPAEISKPEMQEPGRPSSLAARDQRAIAKFVVATPQRSVCDDNARALEAEDLLRFLALGTRRGTRGVSREHTR